MESLGMKRVALAMITGVTVGWLVGVVVLILVVELSDGKAWDTVWFSI